MSPVELFLHAMRDGAATLIGVYAYLELIEMYSRWRDARIQRQQPIERKYHDAV